MNDMADIKNYIPAPREEYRRLVKAECHLNTLFAMAETEMHAQYKSEIQKLAELLRAEYYELRGDE